MLAYQWVFFQLKQKSLGDMPLAQYYKLVYTMSVGKGEMCCCGCVKSVLTLSF